MAEWLVAVLLLFLGAVVYLLLRPNTLLMFRMADVVGATDIINRLRLESSSIILPEWLVFSLPAALWATAYILIIDALWSDARFLIRIALAALMPFVGMVAEMMQRMGWVRGTFDTLDLVFYAVPYMIYVFYVIMSK